MGGAGTGVGFPLEPPVEPELELDDEELDELELEDEPPSPPVLLELVLDEPFELNPPLVELTPLELGWSPPVELDPPDAPF